MKKQIAILLLVLVLAFSMFTTAFGQQTSLGQRETEETGIQDKLKTPLQITKKPVVLIYTACGNESGTVIFDVTFDKTGKVAQVETLRKSSCSYFDKQAEKAALEIEFRPATENAQPMTVVKTVDYSWGLANCSWGSLKYAGNF